MKRRWMGLTLAFLLLAAIFPGRAGAGSKHLLNVYGAQDFVLENVTLDHGPAGYAGAPLVITGSTARL